MKSIMVLLLVSILFQSNLQAQGFYIPCDEPTIKDERLKATVGGAYKPSSNGPGEFFRALIVFAQFDDDTSEISGWPKNNLPNWAFNIIDSETSQNYRPYTISDYFKKMSKGNFDFIGDVYPTIIRIPTIRNYDDANIYVVNKLNELITNFKRYDNWYFNNGAFYFSEESGDNVLDMLIIIYRNPNNYIFKLKGGVASLDIPNKIMHDGVIINGSFGVYGSGITSSVRYQMNAFSYTLHLAHEYGHYLFGYFHTSISGIMAGYPWNYDETYAMNAWERERLGYISISSAYNGQTKTLRDYVTTGDALRINISQGEYLILENHQRLSPYDQIIRGGSLQGSLDPNAQLGKGLYIWYIKNGDIFPPEIYSIQADGGFKWQFAGRRTMYGWNTPPPVVPLLERGEVYRYLPNDYEEIGKCDRNKLYYFASDLNRWEYDYRWWDRDPLTKEWIINRDAMGDETDAFNFNTNDQITPWSNPSTTKFVNNTEILTGISVKILAQNGNDLIVRVYTSVSGSLSLPPSKPQRLSVSKNALNQAVLTWSPNIEPDVISGGRYKIYRASSNDNNPPQFWTLIANVPAYKEGIPVTSFTDVDVYVGSGNSKLFYRITAVDNTNLESKPSDFDWINWDQSMQKTVNRIYDFELNQNYPNPFNPVTKIRYTLKETNPVMIKLYDIVGREVATLVNEVKDAGEYEVELDAGRLGLSSGVYFYQMKAGEFTSIKKMVVLK